MGMYDCWLGYRPVFRPAAAPDALRRVAASGGAAAGRTALDELVRGLSALTGDVPAVVPPGAGEPHVLIAGPESAASAEVRRELGRPAEGEDEAILIVTRDRPQRIVITSNTDAGCLHAVFAFLRRLQTVQTGTGQTGTGQTGTGQTGTGQTGTGRGGQTGTGQARPDLTRMEPDLTRMEIADTTGNKLRMVSHWDNIDGTVERGYAGRSIFFGGGEVTRNLGRVRDYARLLASVGVNAVCVNNVNVTREATELLTARHLPELARLAGIFRDYGIWLFLSVSFDSPAVLSGLRTADPLDPEVADWWRRQAALVYEHIGDFGGFQVKADSEGRPGPSVYGRTQAEGANMLAEAVNPFGGMVVWRAFVYNCRQDWRDRTTDRARACYDTFMPLDGGFAPNVVVQTKLGPVDFQVREPPSPLLTALRATNQVIEVQITQEYTGQQKDLCFLHPQWHEVMSAPASVDGRATTLARVVAGHETGRPLGGVTGVANVGDDPSWTGHVLAQANLYAFGRLAWDPCLGPEEVAGEWVAQTFGADEPAASAVRGMLLGSWGVYESYTAPLGVGWMVTPHSHYGPDVDGYEYSRWGTYHFADRDGIGVDRTVKTGTGFTAQYEGALASVYEDIATCPDELLLFFHHVPYRHVLKSGKTVIQHIYDSRFDGADAAAELLGTWLSLESRVDPATFRNVRDRLELQVANAREWRDIVSTYFFRKSGIPDERGREIY